MTSENIQKLKSEAEAEFNELQSRGNGLRDEVAKIEDRLKELRGKYEAFTALETPDEATTVVAKEAKVGRAK